MRRLNAFGWNMLVNMFFGYTARDVDCAFKLFRRSIFDNMVIRSRGAALSAEFLVRSRRAGYRFLEKGVSHRPRGFRQRYRGQAGGNSKSIPGVDRVSGSRCAKSEATSAKAEGADSTK